MKYDASLLLSSAQAPASGSASESTNVIDTRNLVNKFNGCNNLYLVVDCDTAMTGASPAMSLAVRSSATTSGGALSGTIVTHQTVVPSVTAGKQKLVTRIPMGCLRYLAVTYTTSGTITATGTWTAYITDGVDSDFPVRID